MNDNKPVNDEKPLIAPSLLTEGLERALYRTCGECHERTVPARIDWPWWHDGSPICLKCHAL